MFLVGNRPTSEARRHNAVLVEQPLPPFVARLGILIGAGEIEGGVGKTGCGSLSAGRRHAADKDIVIEGRAAGGGGNALHQAFVGG